jgi:hypothetical protein
MTDQNGAIRKVEGAARDLTRQMIPDGPDSFAMWSPSPLQRSATAELADRLRWLLPRSPLPLIDSSGFVREFRDNLLPHLAGDDAAWIRECFEQGDGDELAPRHGRRPKAHAAYSSATLAANTFAPFRGREHDLTIAGLSGFDALRLEARHHPLPDDVADGRAANLDVELTGPGIAVGIESKLTEPLTAHVPRRWRWEYARTETLAPLSDPWRDAIRRRLQGSTTPTFLDAAQLLKHALALARAARAGDLGPSPVDLHLVYLYWEPADVELPDAVLEHRAEVAAFADEVAGHGPTFHALTHQQLWDGWRSAPESPRWLVRHADALEERYEVELAG